MNHCYTYFRIAGDFNPDDITEILGIDPYKAVTAGDLRTNGTQHDTSMWCGCRCDKYDVYVENQIRNTISQLKDKIDILNKIYQENDVVYFLEVVPTISTDESTPCLSLPFDVIDFCHATKTVIDIDLYIDEKD